MMTAGVLLAIVVVTAFGTAALCWMISTPTRVPEPSPPLDLSRLIPPDAKAAGVRPSAEAVVEVKITGLRPGAGDLLTDVMRMARHVEPETGAQQAVREALDSELRRHRDAAVSLLLETPAACSERAPLLGACGNCWPCRVDAFLRGEGLRG